MGFHDTLVSARSGDKGAEQALFGRWRSLLQVHARKSLGRDCAARVDPSDVVQEALAQASRDLIRFQGNEEAQWVRWLQTIVAGQAAKLRRHHHAQKRDVKRDQEPPPAITPDPPTSPLEQMQKLEEAATTADALEQLPADMKTAIIHRVFLQQSWQEIAELLHKSPSAARVLWTRGLRKLKEILSA